MAALNPRKTGLTFDMCMAEYHCVYDSTYVENPHRFLRVLSRFQELNLDKRAVFIEPRHATCGELLTVHSSKMVEGLKKISDIDESDAETLKKESSKYDCIYLHPKCYDIARIAAGSAINLTGNCLLYNGVLNGNIENGFGLLRPPGHHAMHDDICGYCYFNNIALCARHGLSKGLQRIAIVDWDVHHGQGTQRAFYGDNRVLYFSIHRYEWGGWWPELRESDFDHIGFGPGKGFNVNVPLNRIGNTDSDYLFAFQEVLMPMLREYDPELVLVSAGFDPAIGCCEGEQEVSPAAFAHFTHMLTSFGQGKVVALLEGGYFLSSLAEGAALTMKTLLGDPVPRLPQKLIQACPEMREAVQNVKIALRPHWKCFQTEVHNPSLTSQTHWVGPTGPPPTEFDPMCPTPPRPVDVEAQFEAVMAQLKADTDLSSAEQRLSIVVDYESIQLPEELQAHVVSPEEATNMKQLRARIINKEVQAILEITEADPGENSCFQIAFWRDFEDTKSCLSFAIQPGQSSWAFMTENASYQLYIGSEQISEGPALSALWRSIVPAGNSLRPALVTVAVKDCRIISPLLLSHFVHHLCMAANGKIIVSLNPDQGEDHIPAVASTLLKQPLHRPRSTEEESREQDWQAVEDLRQMIMKDFY